MNLMSSYKFRALDEYLISEDEWVNDKPNLIKQAGLDPFQDSGQVLLNLETVLDQEYTKTNDNIKNGTNKYIKVHKTNDFKVITPALKSSSSNFMIDSTRRSAWALQGFVAN